MKRLVVLISGRGLNLQSVIDACRDGRIPGEIARVVSDRPEAAGLQRAQHAGIPGLVLTPQSYADRATYDAALAELVDAVEPDVVVLAGFMRILSAGFVQRFRGRLVNIHPSLLPLYPGLHTHRRALESGDAEHGATVHYVTEVLDGGPRLIQGRVSLRPDDDAATLAEHVMRQVEVRIYPQALAWILRGNVALDGDDLRFRGQLLREPLTLEDLEPDFR